MIVYLKGNFVEIQKDIYKFVLFQREGFDINYSQTTIKCPNDF